MVTFFFKKSRYRSYAAGRTVSCSSSIVTKFEKIVEYEDVCVGDTFAARVRGNRFIQYDNNTNCLTEDLTAYASVEAAMSMVAGTARSMGVTVEE